MVKNKILDTINKYKMIESGEGIVVGVSGGPDSMCLLNNLISINNDEKINLNFKLYVAHINHMIREEADSETEYVKSYCEKNGIDCYIKKIDVQELAKNEKIGTEEAGRKVRYDFFEEVLEKTKSSKIAIAHNMNDRAETVIMNIIRGTGPQGLKGIEAYRNGKYIRPLIEITRKEIEEDCKENNLNPKIDKSNFENIYTRNKIRNKLIPYIEEEFNPNILSAINKLSIISEEEQNYLDKIVNNTYEELKIDSDPITLNLKKFNEQNVVIKRKLILHAIREAYGNTNNIEKIHIDDIIEMCNKNVGNKYLTPHKNIKVYVKGGKIFFMA